MSRVLELVQCCVHRPQQAPRRGEADQDVTGVQVRVDQVVKQHHLRRNTCTKVW
jgi:hypothetical protein